MKQSVVQGYTVLDNCFKYTNSDSTIDCYMFTRQALQNTIKTNDPELKTNSIYLLVGSENNKIKVYVGQAALGADGESVFRRMKQHIDRKAEVKEKYFPYWTHAIIFASKNTNPDDKWKTSDIDDLESILIKDTALGYSWNSKNETIRNEISSERTRSHARKLFDIKEYIKDLGFNFFDEIKQHEINTNSSYEDKLAAEEKKLIDKTIKIETINLEPNASVPEYTTPEKVVNDMLDLLPWETFDHTTTFFDPACKGGEFLALIHDRLSDVLANDPYFDKYNGRDKFVRIHHHIIRNQLYGIAIGENSYKVAKERVYDCGNIIRASSNYIKNLKEQRKSNKDKLNGAIDLEHEAITKEFNKDMKFDVVIGNPPYQGADNKSSIYPEFVESAIDLSDIVCMITRDNWLTGMAFEDMRNHMLINGDVQKITHYPIVGELFSNVGVAVAYFIWKRNYTGNTSYIRVEHGKEVSKRIVDINNIINSDIAGSILYKIKSNGNWADIFNSRSYPFMDQRKRFSLDISEKPSDYYSVAVHINKEEPVFTNICYFKNIGEVQSYKILCGVKINEATLNSPGNVLTNIKAIGPMEVASETWSLIATFNNKEETVNCKKYVKSKFFRFLANQTVNVKATVTKNAFKYIPLQDFTSESDIDWSQSITSIDQQLYHKYNLSEEEIAYIESTIKTMDETPRQPEQLESKPVENNMKFTAQDAMANFVNKQLQINSI